MGWDMSQDVTHKLCKSATCTIKEPQPIENFCRSKSFKSGRNSKCKTCTRKVFADYTKKRKETGALEKERAEYNATISSESQRKILNRVSRTLSKSFFLNSNYQLTLNFGEVHEH